MNKITGQNISFYGVSINTKMPKKSNMSPTQVINWGLETVDKLKQHKGCDTFTLNSELSKIDNEISAERKKAAQKPWLIRNYRLHRLERNEIRRKEAVNAQQEKLLAQETERVSEMGRVVDQVEEEINNIDEKNSAYRRRIKASDTIERLRVANTAGSGGFSTMAGYDSEKNILRKYFISRIKREEAGHETSVPGSVLFFGPTGNGKTTFAKAFAHETECALVPLRLGLSKNKYGTFMRSLMDEAKKSEENFQETGKRTIIFIDEFTKVSNAQSPINGDLAKFLKTCSDKYHCTVFATANDPLKIKMPITGSKNIFPYIISLDPPNKENKTKVLQYYLKDRLPKDTNFDEMANYMEDIEGKLGRRFNIAQIQATMEAGQEKNLKTEDVYKQIDQMVPALDSEHLARYNEAVDKLMVNQVNG